MVISVSLPFPVLRTLEGGAFAEVFEVQGPQGPAILKLARAEALGGRYTTLGAALAGGVAFHTGSLGAWNPDPNEVVAAEEGQLAAIAHPAFPRVLASGALEADGRRYFLMERIEGESWREKLRRNEAIPLAGLALLATALDDVRRAGMLAYHGDIKPENVLAEPSGRVRLVDPCSSLVREVDGQPVEMLITEDYNPFFSRSDLPALGFTIIEAVSTLHPLRVAGPLGVNLKPLGPALTALLTQQATIGHSYLLKRLAWMPLPTELVSDFPPALEAIALRCLGLARYQGNGYELTAPYADVGELARELRALAGMAD